MFSWLPQNVLDILNSQTFQYLFLVPLLLIALDVVTGIMSASKRGVFTLKDMTSFLGNDLIKYIGAFFLVVFIYARSGSVAASAIVSTLGMGGLSVSVVASIWQNLHEVFSPVVMAAIDQDAAALGIVDPYASQDQVPFVTSVPAPLPVNGSNPPA